MLERELDTAIALARKAGERILQHYAAGFVTEQKIGADNFSEPVTIADREASRIIVDGLIEAFPADAILSEEEKDDLKLRLSKRRVWIIDPIDGTAGFVKHDGDFCVQIGLAEEGTATLGVVYLPAYDLMVYAVKGGGSYQVTTGSQPKRMETSCCREFQDMVLAVSRNHLSPRMNRIIEHFGFSRIVRRGSVGLKVGLIVDQTCDLYVHPSPRTKLWDTCAPQIILEEAGGRFTDLFGLPLRYDTADLQNHNGIVATSGEVHADVIAHLEPILAEFGRVPYVPKDSV
jgi:3'(2'), 5'-bisphosphate nucleotidase